MNNRVVIVTGDAMGIGEAMAKDLLTCNVGVVIFNLIKPKDFSEDGRRTYVCLDIRNKKEVEATINAVVQKFGTVDTLVNDADMTRPRTPVDYYGSEPQYELSEEDFDFMVGVNRKGAFLVPQTVTRVLYGKKEGVIVNLSSCTGLMGSRGYSCYSVTKAATHALTISWAEELGPYNIRVVDTAPDTPNHTSVNNDEKYRAQAYGRDWDVSTRPEEFLKSYKSSIPLGRPGHLYEVADLIYYLTSDHASYITDVIIPTPEGESKGQKTQGLNVTTRIRVQQSTAQTAFYKVFYFSIIWAVKKAIQKSKFYTLKRCRPPCDMDPWRNGRLGEHERGSTY